ncbi:MAG: ribonuclease J [Marinospirillum sp.]|uniref:ribonuclease J n=1 Tax=Marinospirillum sp. TaxID=2183934 RepID=UPI001A05AA16|nr:ribonuclease J [Marinospirillum sp.]MBE0508839.1 ribonuclease J [Marinospirillum sp.]
MQSPDQHTLHQATGPFFLPLGGAGEIGANFYLYASGGYWIAVDCGQGFQNTPAGTAAILIPDINFLEDNGIRVQAILITHGHEDHIGALPYLWKQLDCPVYASPFAAELIRSRIKPENLPAAINLINPLRPYAFGPFTAEWIPVTHSIPEAHGIYLQVAGRQIYHTGDWKLDPAPVLGQLTAIKRLQEIGQSGVDLVVGDSTNAPKAGHSQSEKEVQEGLLQLIQSLPNRVLVTCFASNLARISSLGSVARQTGRHLALLGFSMNRVHGIGNKLGYLPDFPPQIAVTDLGYLPRNEQLLICTGSQGEPGAALAQMAAGRHRFLELEAGDHVVFSSKTIPGNEEAVEQLVQQLQQRGIEIFTEEHGVIHASGHPAQDELRQLYAWLKPTHLLAMHGEAFHEQAHTQLAKSLGINANPALDGELMDISASPRLIARIQTELQVVQPIYR